MRAPPRGSARWLRAAAAAAVGRLAPPPRGARVMLFRNLIEATSRLSTSSVVLVSRYMWQSSSVIARPRPSAVLFIATEMLADSIAGLLGRVHRRHRRERVDQADHGAEQAHQHADVGERGEVMRALLEARDHLDQALFHRLLDVLAAARRRDARHAVAHDGGERRVGLLGELHGLAEVAGLEQRRELGPQAAIAARRRGAGR